MKYKYTEFSLITPNHKEHIILANDKEELLTRMLILLGLEESIGTTELKWSGVSGENCYLVFNKPFKGLTGRYGMIEVLDQ